MAFNKSLLPKEMQSIYEELMMPVDTDIKLTSVILSQDNLEKIKTFILEYQHRADLLRNKLQPMNRLLFYGASGTGKTFLAKALSNHLGYNMFYIDIAKALSENTVAKNLSDVFKLAAHIKNCMIFLDECDSVAWNRDSDNADGGIIRRATNTIFQQLDQMDSSNVFVSATNMLNRLDPAFERRFNLKLEFRRPSIVVRDTMRHFIFPQFSIKEDADEGNYTTIERRVNQNTKLSYYELEGIAHRAMKKAVIAGTTQVRMSDILKDISLAMNIKVNFQTDKDPEEDFQSSIK